MKQANIHAQRTYFLVFFGYLEGGEFRCAYGKPSRTYKTLKGAQRAKAAWEAKSERDAQDEIEAALLRRMARGIAAE